MHIPPVFYPKKTHDLRASFLLSYVTIVMMLFSFLYTVFILFDYIQDRETYVGLSPFSACIISLLFFSSYVANAKKYIHMSISILSATIGTLCTVVGIWWGFDLPMVLLGYMLSIALMSVVTSAHIQILHVLGIIGMMLVGYVYRGLQAHPITWHTTAFTVFDIIEISVIFISITSILIFSQRASHKLLVRAQRTERVLQEERDALEETVEHKIAEIQRIQMEHLTQVYRFVEFGKISSGLFHDLMSPIQTLKLHIASIPEQHPDSLIHTQIAHIQRVSKKIEHMLETMRKQIRFNLVDETFDIVEDVRDILEVTKHLYLTRNIDVRVISENSSYQIYGKRVILHHILMNLISNACEACDSTQDNNSITIRVGSHVHDTYHTYISIEDTGTGIPEKELVHIFNPFYSTKQKTSTNCGIGLSSAKHAVEEHLQGKLFVESEEGVGTTMTVLLPNLRIQPSQSPQAQ